MNRQPRITQRAFWQLIAYKTENPGSNHKNDGKPMDRLRYTKNFLHRHHKCQTMTGLVQLGGANDR